MTRPTYSRRLRNATWLAFLAPLAIVLPMSFLLRTVAPGEQFWLVLGTGLAVLAATLWAGLPWWRAMDDMQKHGQMIAWYWGGIGGGLAMLMWLIAALGLNSDQAQGAVALFGGQAVGFLAFWAVWKWRKRGGDS